jgi:hypothetical protein
MTNRKPKKPEGNNLMTLSLEEKQKRVENLRLCMPSLKPVMNERGCLPHSKQLVCWSD